MVPSAFLVAVPWVGAWVIASELTSRVEDLSHALAEESLCFFDAKSRHYQREADALLRIHRQQSRRHFLSNLNRYPRRILAQQIASRVRRRLVARAAAL